MKSVEKQGRIMNFVILLSKILTFSSGETVPLINQFLYVNKKLISLAIY